VIVQEIAAELSLSDGIFVYENVTPCLGLSVSESLAAADSVEVKLIILMNEYLWATDTLSSQWKANFSVSETLAITDIAEWVRVLYVTISEALAATDAVTPVQVVLVNDYLWLSEAITASGIFNKTVSETIAATDAVVAQWVLSLIESLGIVDALTAIKSVNETINEELWATDTLTALGVFNVSISDTANLSEYVKDAIGLYLSESLAATDTITCTSEMYLTLSESLSAVDAITAALTVSLSVSDNIAIVDTVSSQGTFYCTIQEGVHLDITVELNNEIYECWVLNTPKFYPSVYSGFNFNSYCEYGGRAFGANATGIFELAGTTDNGSTIHSGVLLHNTDFGIRNDKRFRKAYLGVTGTSPVMVMETDEGDRIAYAIDSGGKVDASKSIHSRNWVLSVADFDTIGIMNLVQVVLARGN